jgi:PIN domain nuclease of toxin-antitoxin system
MITAVADTHAVIWYFVNDPRLSNLAKQSFEKAAQQGEQIGISSITLVEMVYLVEKGRIPAGRFTQLATALDDSESLLVEVPVTLGIARALSQVNVNQIPDMPDRIIAATSVYLGVPIISRDGKIQGSGLTTVW